MRIDIACFTALGQTLGEQLAERLRAEGEETSCARCGGQNKSVGEWTAAHFPAADALVFIGATGIAVRAVAPHLRSKTTDPAAVVLDDTARFAISLLSGHLGGANALAARCAKITGATPVITTATDNSGVFAVDSWAQERGFFIANPERIKTVSARALAGQDVTAADMVIDIFRSKNEDEKTLHLVPRRAVLGIGCRKDTTRETLEQAFQTFCEQTRIHPQAFAKVCSVDRKQSEPGLIAFCAAHALPLETFPAETLAAQSGAFAASAFVAAATGVDNVCERAAAAGSEGGELIIGKTVIAHVALAAAIYREEPK